MDDSTNVFVTERNIDIYLSRAFETNDLQERDTVLRLLVEEQSRMGARREHLENGHRRSLGYEVDEAAHGQAALAVIERTVPPFRLLLTDVVMPGPVGGRALAEQVMTRWPDIAIVFMSGYTENVATRQGGLPAGALLLEKPFRKRDLARMVRAVLDAED